MTSLERKLTPRARMLLDTEASDAERIYEIKSEHFIPHARAQKTLSDLEDLYNHPPTHRKPNRLLIAHTNNGKTMLVKRFIKAHPPSDELNEDSIRVPVLYVHMPAEPSTRSFYIAILESVHSDVVDSSSTAYLGRQTLHVLKAMNLKMLILDEMHNLFKGGHIKQKRQILNAIREIANVVEVSIVACGLHEASSAINSDDQLANRFTPIILPRWNVGRELAVMLRSIETVLPLRKVSNLSDPEKMQLIRSRSEGTIGEIILLLREAAIEAIKKGNEEISIERLQTRNYISPSIRKNMAEKEMRR